MLLALENSLPGELAHSKVMKDRKSILDKSLDLSSARKSAVLILVYPKEEELYTVFIQRQVYEGVHSGQIGFPGGKSEETDNSLLDTALREANEEIGVFPKEIEVIGNLSPLYIPPSNFIVHPYIGVQNSLPEFIPEEKEVRQILEVPLKQLIGKDKLIDTRVSISPELNIPVKAYQIDNHIIWGATCMILTEFLDLWNSLNK